MYLWDSHKQFSTSCSSGFCTSGDGDTIMSEANLVHSYRASALSQWHAGGGGVLERTTQTSARGLELASTAREAFVVAQTAAALDVHQQGVLRTLRELNGSAPSEPPEPALAAPQPSGADRYAGDDVSDGNAGQGALVSSHVRPGKPEEAISSAGEYRAPDGSLRLVQAELLSEDERARLLGATLVAMAGAFSQCGQTRLGMSPMLASRMAALPGGGGAPVGQLYTTVERARRTVARAFGADLATLRVSDATVVRLQAAPEVAAASAAGALDVGVLRGDPFCYWRPHIDKVSVDEYEYSALLYLAKHGTDFEGGRLVFHDEDADRVVAPEPGTLVAFCSGNANLHAVERVSRGSRFALTMWFTSEPEPADLDPVHRAMLHWARDAEAAAEAAAAAATTAAAAAAAATGSAPACSAPPLPASLPASSALLTRDAELVSAAACSLPANDILSQALRVAHARGGQVVQTLARGLSLPAGAAHCAPTAAPAAGDDAAPGEAPNPLLRSRLQAHAAMATTLQRAQEARGAFDTPAAPTAAAEDDFSVFD